MRWTSWCDSIGKGITQQLGLLYVIWSIFKTHLPWLSLLTLLHDRAHVVFDWSWITCWNITHLVILSFMVNIAASPCSCTISFILLISTTRHILEFLYTMHYSYAFTLQLSGNLLWCTLLNVRWFCSIIKGRELLLKGLSSEEAGLAILTRQQVSIQTLRHSECWRS
jgi:hypothetical protein